MNIAFAVSSLAFIGLGPTVVSLIRNCSDTSRLNLYFVLSEITPLDKLNLSNLLRSENYKGTVSYIDFDSKEYFGHLRSLHGDWTAYGRLLFPDLLKVDKVLYLDADLIIELDLLKYENFDFNGNSLCAVSTATLQHAYDNQFLNQKLGIPLDTPYFNSGIMYMNLNMWRSENLKQKCLALAEEYPAELTSHDQTLLNAVFVSRFTSLPAELNCPWYGYAEKPVRANKMILHFLGSPKPWDMFAGLIHKGYSTWVKYLTPEWKSLYGGTRFCRVWNLRRSYYRTIRRRLTA